MKMAEVKVQGIVTLAALTVRGAELVSKSEGVTYDPATGVVSFPNPLNLTVVPVISDVAAKNPEHYITETHFIREVNVGGKTNQFRVWRKPLDTGIRDHAPSDFTAVVVGF